MSIITPELQDRILVVRKDARVGGYALPEKGDAFDGPEAHSFRDFKFATAKPSDQTGWVDWYYINERLNQDAYNYTIEYPWVDESYPRVTRTYVFLRDSYTEPTGEEPDPAYPALILVNQTVTRAEDPVVDALFVTVNKIFERVPAPTEYVLDRPEHALPFNMRVAVPASEVNTVEHGAAVPPTIVQEEDWHVQSQTTSAFRRTLQRIKRVIPGGQQVLGAGRKLTRDQQRATVTSSWKIGPQEIIPRATLLEASVDDIGNNTTVLEEVEVDSVAPLSRFSVEVPDLIPIEFRDLIPVETRASDSAGVPSPPVLGPGELARISEATTTLKKREHVTSRNIDQLPITKHDRAIGGISGHGSVFGGIMDTTRTLDRVPQTVDEGFDVVASSTKELTAGITLKSTERITTSQASLLVTNPGSGYTSPPTVTFSGGDAGSGATASAVMTPVAPVFGGLDSGGEFSLEFSSFGDSAGLFYFIGARSNGGSWQNPFDAQQIDISTLANTSAFGSLSRLLDRQSSTSTIFDSAHDQNFFRFYLGIGRTIRPSLLVLRSPNTPQPTAQDCRVEGSFDGLNWRNLAGISVPTTPNSWVATLISTVSYFPYLRIRRASHNGDSSILSLGEVEFYGDLQILPAKQLDYAYDGDALGVFNFLGEYGGDGVWRNPHTAGDITVRADYLAAGTLDQIVDRSPSNVIQTELANLSYYFDLGEGRNLICNKFSFRQRSEVGTGTRTFVFQGRHDVTDDTSWVNLRTVNAPPTSPNQWKSFDVPVTGAFYRQFRIISQQGYFTIGEFELYGQLMLPIIGGAGINNRVGSITVLTPGENYTTAPQVQITGGGGTGATATAEIAYGQVRRVLVTNGGTGYTTTPDVSLIPDAGAAPSAIAVLGYGVSSVTVSSAGSGYLYPPAVLFGTTTSEGVDGGGAAGVAVLGRTLANIILTSPGSGYSTAPAISVTGGGGYGAYASATIGFSVSGATVGSGGSGYGPDTSLLFSGNGTGATGHVVFGKGLDGPIILTAGSGYTSAPTVVFTGGGGTGGAATAILGFPVASATLSSGGAYYTSAPDITIEGDGTGATAVANLALKVSSIAVTNGGTGYTSPPTVAFTGGGGGTGATATAVLTGTTVTSVTVTAGGDGFTSPPTIGFSGGGGTGAAADAIMAPSGTVSSISIVDGGVGYTVAPTVRLTGGGGAGATATTTLGTSGSVKQVTLTNAGTGYISAPSTALTGGGGTGATAGVSLGLPSNVIAAVVIDSPGSGYTSAPTATVIGAGTGASVTATLATLGQIKAVFITTAGNGFEAPPNIGISGGGGSGAAARAVLSTTGTVVRVQITSPGRDFTSVPSLTFSPGSSGGSGATGYAVLDSTGYVAALILTYTGPSFTVAPTVTITGGGGSGATGIYILGTGWPVLFDTTTDDSTGIIVKMRKEIVLPATQHPGGGGLAGVAAGDALDITIILPPPSCPPPPPALYVDIYALDKYRSVQISSALNLHSLPVPEIFGTWHPYTFPNVLVSVRGIWSNSSASSSSGVGLNGTPTSTSSSSSVKGSAVIHIKHGYSGYCEAEVTRLYTLGPPCADGLPCPLLVEPSSGTVIATGGSSSHSQTLGRWNGIDTAGIPPPGPIELPVVSSSIGVGTSIGTQSVGPVLTGNYTVTGTTDATGRGSLVVELPPSTPLSFTPGDTFIVAVEPRKWRFGVWVTDIIRLKVPPCRVAGGGGGSG